MVEKSKLDEDKEGKAIDPSHYRGMIGTPLLYLTATLAEKELNFLSQAGNAEFLTQDTLKQLADEVDE
ncbi:hypothetical protein Tco_0523734 [Tanacetum coccineum]